MDNSDVENFPQNLNPSSSRQNQGLQPESNRFDFQKSTSESYQSEPIYEDAKDITIQDSKTSSVTMNDENRVALLTFALILGTMIFFYYYYQSQRIEVYVPQPFDESNKFYYFQMQNGIKVLITNPNNNDVNSYLSTSVGIGSQGDPENFIGFTHLIEHMLFTGSQNYPESTAMGDLIDKYHGYQNGVTQSFATSYFYQIQTEGISELISLLADALAKPLFKKELIEKEINNVNSEISMRMTYNKGLAYYKMIKFLGNPQCKMFNDGFSNIDSSKIDYEKLREQIVDFHKTYYSGNLMTISITSNLDPTYLRNEIEKNFNIIPNHNTERPFVNKNNRKVVLPFKNEQLGNVYYMETDIDVTSLMLVFTIPSEINLREFRSLPFFEIFLKLFAKNSLKDILQTANLISDIGAEEVLEDYDHSIYLVQFDISEQHTDKISEVYLEFFKFIKFLKNYPNIDSFYDKVRNFSKTNFMVNLENSIFKFSESEQEYFDRNLDFSIFLLENNVQELFTAESILQPFDVQKWNQTLDSFSPTNCFCIIESPKFNKKQSDLINDKKQKVIDSYNTRKLGQKDKLKFEEIAEQLKQYFDNIENNIQLDHVLDFDEGKMYAIEKIPMEQLKNLENVIPNKKYHIINFAESPLKNYDIISQCPVPPNLIAEHTEELEEQESEQKPKEILSLKKVNDFVFETDYQSTQANRKQIHLLQSYKMCLKREFEKDSKELRPEKVYENTNVQVYHKLYRKSYQPQVEFIVEISNSYLQENLLNENYLKRIQTKLSINMFCSYMHYHMRYKHFDQILNSSAYGCWLKNNKIVLHVHTLDNYILNTINTFINELLGFKSSEQFDKQLLKNLKEEEINDLNGFQNKNALKKSYYLMDGLIDKMHIQYVSSKQKTQIKQIINSITSKDLQQIAQNLFKDSDINFIFVGNLTEEKSIQISKTLLSTTFKEDIQKNDLLTQKMQNQKLIVIPTGSPKVFRVANPNKLDTNSVYLSYFHIGLTNQMESLELYVIRYFLKNWIFQELREKRNLGYVAGAFTDAYSLNKGLVVVVNGERFKPNEIEQIVDQTINEFLDDFEKTPEKQLLESASNHINQLMEIKGYLKTISTVFISRWEQDVLLHDKSSMKEALKNFDVQRTMQYARKILKENNKRIILEMSSDINIKEAADFVLDQKLTLNGNKYEIQKYDEYRHKYMEGI